MKKNKTIPALCFTAADLFDARSHGRLLMEMGFSRPTFHYWTTKTQLELISNHFNKSLRTREGDDYVTIDVDECIIIFSEQPNIPI